MRLSTESLTKREFLDHIFNDLGFTDLKLAYSHKKANGEVYWTKHVSYDELMHYPDGAMIEKVRMTKKEFLDKCNHRSILDIELLFDIDDPYIKEDGKVTWVYNSVFDKAYSIYNSLKELGKDDYL